MKLGNLDQYLNLTRETQRQKGARSIKLTFSLIVTFHLTEPENGPKKSHTALILLL